MTPFDLQNRNTHGTNNSGVCHLYQLFIISCIKWMASIKQFEEIVLIQDASLMSWLSRVSGAAEWATRTEDIYWNWSLSHQLNLNYGCLWFDWLADKSTERIFRGNSSPLGRSAMPCLAVSASRSLHKAERQTTVLAARDPPLLYNRQRPWN